jgi:CheY-like chemotaxis protein
MSRILEDSPIRRYQVIGAYGGQEGLDMVRLHRPDLVGYQVVQRMRSTPTWQHIPITGLYLVVGSRWFNIRNT